MFGLNKYTAPTVTFSLICILLAGCGVSPQPVQETKVQDSATPDEDIPGQESVVTYTIMKTALPSSEDVLAQDILKSDDWVARERETSFWDGKLYRLSDLFEMVEEKNIFMGACIQMLAPPYERWESLGIYYDEEEDSDLWVEALAGAAENGVLLEMRSMTDEKRYLARYEWDGGMEILLEVPEDLSGAFWHQEDEEFWAVSGGGKILTVFDGMGQQRTSRNLTGKVMGHLQDPRDGNLIWYGFDQGELVLWDQPNGQVQARITDQISQFEDFGIGYSPTGELYLADTKHTWIYDGRETREAFSFQDKNYSLEELFGLGFREDGELLLLAKHEGGQCLLAAETDSMEDIAEKQEVLIVLNTSNPGLQKLAASYNRESKEYHVTIAAAMDSADPEEYRRRIQMEMVAGGGPDLLGDWAVNIRECVTQGYLEPLDEVVEDMSPFLETAFAAGEVKGRLYGVPYECYPYFLAVSAQLADASSWTLEQMYEAVRNSPAEALEADIGGVEIVMVCGLYDEGNKAFIDWERGESHLTEEPFLKLMAFAKEYADRGGYPREEVGERLADGRIVGEQIVLSMPAQLNRARSCFNGEAACIGFPRESGSGIYMEAQRLYLNHNAVNREGALDFLRYLLSEEGQRQYLNYSSWLRLPVRRSLLEECLDRYQQSVTDPPAQSHDDRGIYWQWEMLDEGQVELFWRILDNAVPATFQADGIWSIVDEELQPYFNGVRGAEEAAAALHSRVQVYLDEQK